MPTTIKHEKLVITKLTKLTKLDNLERQCGYGNIDGINIIVSKGSILFTVDGKIPGDDTGILINEGKPFDITGINDIKNFRIINKDKPALIHIIYYKDYIK